MTAQEILDSVSEPGTPVVQTPKRRKSGLSTRDLHALDVACLFLVGLFGAGRVYLVGTAQTGGEYRDVDVRAILPDDEFDAMFGGQPVLWSKFCFLASDWLAHQTGLPVDFQVQRRTEANEKYDGRRNPVGTGRMFAGGGDATPFTPRRETA